MATYYLHIGANNTSGIVEKDKIVQVLSSHFQGFTLQDSVGYWNGKPEYSCIATIANLAEGKQAYSVARELAQVLDQEAVGLSKADVQMDFITAIEA